MRVGSQRCIYVHTRTHSRAYPNARGQGGGERERDWRRRRLGGRRHRKHRSPREASEETTQSVVVVAKLGSGPVLVGAWGWEGGPERKKRRRAAKGQCWLLAAAAETMAAGSAAPPPGHRGTHACAHHNPDGPTIGQVAADNQRDLPLAKLLLGNRKRVRQASGLDSDRGVHAMHAPREGIESHTRA